MVTCFLSSVTEWKKLTKDIDDWRIVNSFVSFLLPPNRRLSILAFFLILLVVIGRFRYTSHMRVLKFNFGDQFGWCVCVKV